MKNLLSQNVIFVEDYIPMDFTKNMGQLAIEIKYTSGDIDMLTTKSTMSNINGSSDFETEAEYFKFIEYLTQNGIKKRNSN